jgi:hypothetical protein
MNGMQNKFKVLSALGHCEQVHCERIGRDYRYNNLSVYRYISRAIINKFQAFFYDRIEQVPGY